MNEKEYPIIAEAPVARFYYQGHHSHPVLRTVLITEVKDDLFTGLELREGTKTRSYKEAKIKSYKLDKIAKIKQCGVRLRKRTPKDRHEHTTLNRYELIDFVKKGP